jgi:thiol-disulfide isomerase/thioredoxin
MMLCLPVLAADLRAIKDPAKIASVFPAAAKVRVVNVWAMWCVPCVAEMPDLRAIDEAFGAEVTLAGVSLDDMLPDAKSEKTAQFLDKQKIAFPNVFYTGNADELGEQLKFSGEIPVTIVFDRKGNELWRHQGRLDREKTIARLRETLRRMK